jgi:hypothetical protein
MPVKIFHGRERNQELPALEDEINCFEQQLHTKGMQIKQYYFVCNLRGKVSSHSSL